MSSKIAIVGSGPSALMAADQLSSLGYRVSLFEKRGAIGRKLFIAGSSGLNITHALPSEQFSFFYQGGKKEFWSEVFSGYGPKEWTEFIEAKLGEKTFLGTSGRYFVRSMTAVGLVRAWKKRLHHLGVHFYMNHEWVGMSQNSDKDYFRATSRPTIEGTDGSHPKSTKVTLTFKNGHTESFDAVCLCLGGASWESDVPLPWVSIFENHHIVVEDFKPTNTGWHVELSQKFFSEAEGQPLKNIVFSSSLGTKKGDLVVTSYGLEGTPVYFMGCEGFCYIDLKPDLTEKAVFDRLNSVKENMSPFRRVKKTLKLSRASESLIFHVASESGVTNLAEMAALVKKVPIRFLAPRPLSEAISSKGGVSFNELTPNLMLKKFPGVFLAGEMISWDAPTGGFLIQGCVSLAVKAAKEVDHYLRTQTLKLTE